MVLTLGNKERELKQNRMIGMMCINAYLRNNSIGNQVSNRMPMCILTLNLDGAIIKELFENADNSKMSLSIVEIALDKDMQQVGANSFINDSFDILPVKSVDNYMIPDGTTEETVENVMTQLQSLDIYLYKKTIINYFNQEASLNLHNVSKAAALQSLFRIRNIPFRTVIATPPQDNNAITNCTIPMNTLIQNIDELNTYYGIYTCTPLVYWDFLYNEMYCINRFEPNIIIKSNTSYDTVQFRLHSVTDARAISVGSLDSLSDKMHLVALNSVPTIYNTDSTRKYTSFSTLTTVNTSTGKVTKETLDKDSTKNSYVIENNLFTTAQQINDRLVPNSLVALSITDASLRIFKPYKTYRFLADAEYDPLDLNNKKFRIGYYGFELHSEGETDFSPRIELSLYVVSDEYRSK